MSMGYKSRHAYGIKISGRGWIRKCEFWGNILILAGLSDLWQHGHNFVRSPRVVGFHSKCYIGLRNTIIHSSVSSLDQQHCAPRGHNVMGIGRGSSTQWWLQFHQCYLEGQILWKRQRNWYDPYSGMNPCAIREGHWWAMICFVQLSCWTSACLIVLSQISMLVIFCCLRAILCAVTFIHSKTLYQVNWFQKNAYCKATRPLQHFPLLWSSCGKNLSMHANTGPQKSVYCRLINVDWRKV